MIQSVNVVLLAALALTALAWKLDLGSRRTQLITATCVALALNVATVWQEKPWYVSAVCGGLMGLLLPALRREIVRCKVAKTRVAESTS